MSETLTYTVAWGPDDQTTYHHFSRVRSPLKAHRPALAFALVAIDNEGEPDWWWVDDVKLGLDGLETYYRHECPWVFGADGNDPLSYEVFTPNS